MRKQTLQIIERTGGPATASEAKAAIEQLKLYYEKHRRLSLDDRKSLLAAIARIQGVLAEYQRIDILEEAERTLELLLKLDNKDVISLIALSDLHHYQTKQLDRALNWIMRATEIADKQSAFVRLAYSQLGRLAVLLGRADLATKALTRLIEYEPKKRSSDITLEADVFSRIPEDWAIEELISAYERKVNAKLGIRK